jgi:hypothetical protein
VKITIRNVIRGQNRSNWTKHECDGKQNMQLKAYKGAHKQAECWIWQKVHIFIVN